MQVMLRTLKYGGYLQETRAAELITRSPYYLILRQAADYCFFPLGQWFYVRAARQASGELTYCCRVIMPVLHTANVLEHIDLDLGVVYTRGTWQAISRDQFAENALTYNYPQELRYRAQHELGRLRERVDKGGFPFNGFLDRVLALIDLGASRGVTAADFAWDAWERTIRERGFVIDRPQGSRHPQYPYIVYPVAYGYIPHVMGWDDLEQDVFVGNPAGPLSGVVLTADFVKQDHEFKLLWGLSRAQVDVVHAFFNKEPELMVGVLIERPPH